MNQQIEVKFCQGCKDIITYMWSRYYGLRDMGLNEEAQAMKTDALNFMNWGTLHDNDPCKCRKVEVKMDGIDNMIADIKYAIKHNKSIMSNFCPVEITIDVEKKEITEIDMTRIDGSATSEEGRREYLENIIADLEKIKKGN